MFYRVDWNDAKAVIGCGLLLALLGLVIISPIVAWLLDVIGFLLIAAGILVAALGIGSWFLGSGRRD